MRKRFLAMLTSTLLLIVTVAGGAHAITLADANAGAAIMSGDGNLTITFDPGSITVLGDLDGDLSLYELDATLDGFEVSGPLAVFGPLGFGTLLVDYSVSAASDLVGADLTLNAVALGATAFGAVTATLDTGTGLGTVASGAGGGAFTDDGAFAPTGSLSGTTAVQLFAGGVGELASIPTFRQGFQVTVAEPASLLMLGAGIVGLAIAGSRRRPRPQR